MPEDDSLIFAADEIFQSVRQSFTALGYNEGNLRSQYVFDGFPTDAFIWPKFSERKTASASGLDMLVYLFMGQESIPVDEAIRSLGSRFFSEMRELNLLQVEENGSTCLATVRIEPVQNLLICSDCIPDRFPVRADLVLRSWDLNAQAYTRIIPETKCKDLLEMCCGAAHICLAAAGNYAQSVCGVDISLRAVRFAEFNKRLNAVENVRVYCGNLFKPVESSTFDRIVAHPPYIPALKDVMIFKDAGIDGERVSTDLIRGIPAHLTDGGEFYSYLTFSDRIDAPAELRVRELLGADEREFDVALLIAEEKTPDSFLLRRAGSDPFSEENQQMRDACKKLGITRFLSTVLIIRSRRGAFPLTSRHRAVSWQTAAAMADVS